MGWLDTEKAKQLLGDRKCKNELSCVKGGLENLCRAAYVGDKSHLICLEKDQNN